MCCYWFYLTDHLNVPLKNVQNPSKNEYNRCGHYKLTRQTCTCQL